MQTLEIISANLGQILIAMLNLLVLFLLLKYFLYKPVKNTLAKRDAAISEQYESAKNAEEGAQELKRQWETKMESADEEAERIIIRATENAENSSREILSESRDTAKRIIAKAEADAEQERRRAEEDIRREIIDVSTLLSEKLLEREINEEDHRAMIDQFLAEIGDDDDRK